MAYADPYIRQQREVLIAQHYEWLAQRSDLFREYLPMKNDSSAKHKLVKTNPIRAARMFIHCYDNEIGSMFVQRYIEDPKYHEHALALSEELERRKREENAKKKSIEHILGMVSIVEEQGKSNPDQVKWREMNKIDQMQAILEERGH